MRILPSNFLEQFRINGFAVVENFLTRQEVDELRADIAKVIDRTDIKYHTKPFDTSQQQSHANSEDNYFIRSAEGIGIFLEKEAVAHDGTLKVDKQLAVHKVGHGIHLDRAPFSKVTFSEKSKIACKVLDLRRPAVCQSMYIFKQPDIGSANPPHQDATFLYVDPPNDLVAFWIALDDSSEQNGCMYFAPGSHNLGLIDKIRYIRTVDSVTKKPILAFSGCWPIPDADKRFKFEPVSLKAGDAVVYDGLTLHKSNSNRSKMSGNAYCFHVIETKYAKWCRKNWLQPIGQPFAKLY